MGFKKSFRLTPISWIVIIIIIVFKVINGITFNIQIPLIIELITSLILFMAGLNIIFRYIEAPEEKIKKK